jgi:N-acetylmuramoyl-L-alanine amidase
VAKKIYLSPSSQPANTYAVGNTNEQEQCRKIAAVARDALIRCGFEVKAGLDGTMYTRVRESNNWGADAHIPIHTNAFNGKVAGFRGFYYTANGEGHKLVKAIMDTVAPLTPGTSDGLSKQDLYEINNSSGYCAYLELGFHDSKEEAQYIIDHTQELGEAICEGVCKHYGVKYIAPASAGKPAEEPVKTEGKKTVYRVQVGSYSSKANAEKMLKKLKEAGYEGLVVSAEI